LERSDCTAQSSLGWKPSVLLLY